MAIYYTELDAFTFANCIYDGQSLSQIAKVYGISERGLRQLLKRATGRSYKTTVQLIKQGKLNRKLFVKQFQIEAKRNLDNRPKICAAARASQNKMLITIIDERIEEKVKPKLSMISRIIIGIVNKIKRWFRK